jgi:glycine cleavage system H protein
MAPKGLFYTKDHEWAKVEGDTATMGITDYAQEHLGEITFVELPAVGRSVKRKDAIATVESAKAAGDVYAPVSGEVIEVNDSLSSEPERVNQDCYGGGWVCRIRTAGENPTAGLMTAAEYDEYVKGL